jgi:hypothetical protein
VVTAFRLMEGDLTEDHVGTEREREQMEGAVAENGLTAFCEIGVVPDFEDGAIAIVQASGIAGLRSNTIMAGWPSKPGRLEAWLRIVRAVSRAGTSTIIARLKWAHEPGQQKRIDLWWGGLQNNGDMMLLLAHLLSLNPEWRDSRMVVRSISRDEGERKTQAENLAALLAEVRIEADTEFIMKPEGKSVADVIHEQSAGADVVFLGLRDPEAGKEEAYARRMAELTEGLNTTIFVHSSGRFAGKLI